MNLPNKLTLLRIVLVPVCLLLAGYDQYPIAAAVFILAAVTDTLDGYLARKNHLITNFGKFADPIADKMLTTTMFILFASRGIIPVVPVIIMVCRDITVDGMRMIAANNGKVVSAQMMGKLKTVLQMVSIALILLNNLPFELWRLPVSEVVLWFAAFISLASGVSYFNQLKEDILESK